MNTELLEAIMFEGKNKFGARHFKVVFPKGTDSTIVDRILSFLVMKFSRIDKVHFKKAKEQSGIDVIIEKDAPSDILSQIKKFCERGITLEAERRGVLEILDQMPKDPRYN